MVKSDVNLKSFLLLTLLFFTVGCDFGENNNNKENGASKPISHVTPINVGSFVFLNLTDTKFKGFIEKSTSRDNGSELGCAQEQGNTPCIANVIDLNHDNYPEIIFESRLSYVGNSGALNVLSNVGGKWQRFSMLSLGYRGFGRKESKSETAFNSGEINSVAPKWYDLKIGSDIYSASYGGEPLPPMSSFNWFEQIFGTFPAAYRQEWVKDKFRQKSLRPLQASVVIPSEIFNQDFDKEKGGELPCNDATKSQCVVSSIDLNGDGNNELLVEESPGYYFAFFKENNKWDIISFSKTNQDIFYHPISMIKVQPTAIKPRWDDILLDKYVYRVSPRPCSDDAKGSNC